LSPFKCLQCVTQKQKQNQQKQHNSFFVYPQTIEIRLTDGCDDSSNELISAMRLWRRHRPPKTISRRFDDKIRKSIAIAILIASYHFRAQSFRGDFSNGLLTRNFPLQLSLVLTERKLRFHVKKSWDFFKLKIIQNFLGYRKSYIFLDY
jgi:hypothetical protein